MAATFDAFQTVNTANRVKPFINLSTPKITFTSKMNTNTRDGYLEVPPFRDWHGFSLMG